MWKEYQKEKYDRDTIENEHGFINYNKHDDGSVYINILYVKKKERDKGTGKELEKMLIKKEEPTMIFCDIDMESNGWEKSLIQIVSQANYKYDSTIGRRIILYKDLR
jgi:hypothetical protein